MTTQEKNRIKRRLRILGRRLPAASDYFTQLSNAGRTKEHWFVGDQQILEIIESYVDEPLLRDEVLVKCLHDCNSVWQQLLKDADRD